MSHPPYFFSILATVQLISFIDCTSVRLEISPSLLIEKRTKLEVMMGGGR